MPIERISLQALAGSPIASIEAGTRMYSSLLQAYDFIDALERRVEKLEPVPVYRTPHRFIKDSYTDYGWDVHCECGTVLINMNRWQAMSDWARHMQEVGVL